APALYRLGRRRVEIGMAGGLFHDDVTDTAVDADEDTEQRRALDAGSPRARWIRRPHLITAARRRRLRNRVGREGGDTGRRGPGGRRWTRLRGEPVAAGRERRVDRRQRPAARGR